MLDMSRARQRNRRVGDRSFVEEAKEAMDAFTLSVIAAIDAQEYRSDHHAALNRITVLEGLLTLIAYDLESAPAGVLSGPTADLLASVLKRAGETQRSP